MSLTFTGIVLEDAIWKDPYHIHKAKKFPIIEPPHQIYFMQSGNGPIKIGYSTNIEGRLMSHQTSNPEKLVILRIFKGNRFDESALKRKFKNFRINGEWFQPSQPILDFIENTKI